jgi:hypothetical protein
MNTIIRSIIIVLLSLITVLLVNKGLDLRALGSEVDGDGIGIYFWGLEINEQVPEESIPTYAIGFLVASLIPMSIAIALIGKKILKIKQITSVR